MIVCLVNITMGSSPGCIDAAHEALSICLLESSDVVQLPDVESPPLHEALRAMMESIERASAAAFPWLTARLFIWTSPEWRKQYDMLSTFFNQAVAQARARENAVASSGDGLSTDADCVLDMIIQREARGGAENFGKGEMLDELMTYVMSVTCIFTALLLLTYRVFLSAGQDTTAASLAWLVKFLPLDAEIQHRLHDEVCTVFGPDSNSEDPLDFNLLDNPERVPILEAVVAETLRCAGVASLMGREREFIMY
jgi:cytochrome P450